MQPHCADADMRANNAVFARVDPSFYKMLGACACLGESETERGHRCNVSPFTLTRDSFVSESELVLTNCLNTYSAERAQSQRIDFPA